MTMRNTENRERENVTIGKVVKEIIEGVGIALIFITTFIINLIFYFIQMAVIVAVALAVINHFNPTPPEKLTLDPNPTILTETILTENIITENILGE